MKNKYIRRWISFTLWLTGLTIILALLVKGPLDVLNTGKYNYETYVIYIFQGIIGSASFSALLELIQYFLDRQRIQK